MTKTKVEMIEVLKDFYSEAAILNKGHQSAVFPQGHMPNSAIIRLLQHSTNPIWTLFNYMIRVRAFV